MMIAKQKGARVATQSWNGLRAAEKLRAFARARRRVLSIDADERVTPESRKATGPQSMPARRTATRFRAALSAAA